MMIDIEKLLAELKSVSDILNHLKNNYLIIPKHVSSVLINGNYWKNIDYDKEFVIQKEDFRKLLKGTELESIKKKYYGL